MVDLRPRWAMGYPGYSFYSTQVDLPGAKTMVGRDTMVDLRPRWAMGYPGL